MRKILSSLFLIIIHHICIAQTNVSGFISTNTIWDTLNDPYIITSNVLVNSGVKLTIMPGTVVKFNAMRTLQIDGELNVLGAANHRVTFTANSTNPSAGFWDAIKLTSTTNASKVDSTGAYLSGNIISYADFRYGGSGSVSTLTDGTIECITTTLYLENCTFKKSASNGVLIKENPTNFTGTNYLKENILDSCDIIFVNQGVQKFILSNQINTGSIRFFNDATTIVEKNVLRNTSYGIFCNGPSNLLYIRNNVIISSAQMGYYGIYQNNSNISDYNVISGNLIIGKCKNQFSKSISNNIFVGNTEPIVGHYSAWYPIEFNFNQFIDCVNNSSLLIRFDGNTGYVSYKLKFNLFQNNQVGLNSGIVEHPNTDNWPITFQNNNFIDNQGTYLYKNKNNSTDVNATYNYWDTNDLSVVGDKIYDWFENSSSSFINYTPILMSPDSITPISRPNINSIVSTCAGAMLKWNDNPELDTKGYKLYYGNFNGYQFEHVIDLGNVFNYTIPNLPDYDTVAITAYDNAADGTDDLIYGHESWFRFVYFNTATNQVNLAGLNSEKFCEGGSELLLAGNNYTAYLWSNGNTTSSTYINAPGTYSVIVTDSAGINYCDSIQMSWEDPNINLGPDVMLQPGQTMNLIAYYSGSTYLWNDGSTSSILLIDTAGTYWVKVTSPSGCVFYDSIQISYNYQSIFENEFSKAIKVYPNPANNNINVDFKKIYSNVNLIINDVTGKELFNENYKHQDQLKVGLESFAKGVYIIHITADNKQAVVKLTRH
jgi:hypothetical protein